MKNTTRILTRALTALALGTIGTAASAAPIECGMIGTWAGEDITGGSDVQWISVHTPASTNTRGQMELEWIGLSLIPEGGRVSPGRGVWEQIGNKAGQYKYTWYSIAFDNTGFPVYRLVASGTATNDGCDKINIDYTMQAFLMSWPPQSELSSGTLGGSESGSAVATRMGVMAPVTPP
jgi:hypothetical protein